VVANSVGGQSQPVFGAHVFAEDPVTGRVIAGGITLHSGDYRIDGLATGVYRVIGQSLAGPVAADEIATGHGSYAGLVDTTPPFRTHIATKASAKLISVFADRATSLGFFVASNPEPRLMPQLIGLNGELSTVALPLRPGKKVRVFLAGVGIDEIPAGGISSTSPFISIDPESVSEEQFDTPYPAISFEITVARNAPTGEYSILLQSADGEIAYLVGALTIDDAQ
jgi:hypothetical protein